MALADGTEPAAGEAGNGERQRAEELYKEGALLLGQGKYLEAETRFQDSLKLLNGRGTLLNLAICHENLGRLASAWREFTSVAEQSTGAGDTTRLESAREHLAWIEPQLSYLNVSLSAESPAPGLQVELDGKPLPGFDQPFPVDAGRHQLRASAPGKKDWSVELVVQDGGQRQSLTVPSLQNADVVSPVAVLPPPVPAQVSVASPQPPPAKPPPRADYTSVYIAGGATLALTAGAVASAFVYYDRRAEYHDALNDPEAFSDEELHARRASAERMAWINGSLIVGAGVGAALTGFLWYRTARTKTAPTTKGAWVAPWAVGAGAGLRAGASF